MVKAGLTFARIGKGGVWDHNHDGYGWHWACAGHRDVGAIHKAANASKPQLPDGMPASQLPNYLNALNRVVVTRIPSRAKPKAEDANVALQAAANAQ